MNELLSGQQPLRGRAQLVLRIEPFDYFDAARFWGVAENPELAFRLLALIGGVAGHRRLVGRAAPATVEDLGGWLAETVLDPTNALFGEADYLLREDPRIVERARYQSILAAIAEGRHRPVEIGGLLSRSSQELSHPLDVLRTGGFVDRVEDVLFQRKSAYVLADPIVRLLLGVARPNQMQIEDGEASRGVEQGPADGLRTDLRPAFRVALSNPAAAERA